MNDTPLVLWLADVRPEHKNLVGGKGINLAKLYNELRAEGISVPNGFVLTTEAWKLFSESSGLREQIEEILSKVDCEDAQSRSMHAAHIRRAIELAPIMPALREKIEGGYRVLVEDFWVDVDVAVRSSAIAEDLEDASFAGQHDSFLNIRGVENLVLSVKHCFASFFTDRALYYRYVKKFPLYPEDGGAVVVQKMVRSDNASAGVAFSNDPDSNASYLITVTGSWGLGEASVSGLVTPDTFLFARPLSEDGEPVLVDKEIGAKTEKLVYAYDGALSTKSVEATRAERESFCLSTEDALIIARAVEKIHRRYGKPMDVEWAKDGIGGGRREDGDGTIYIVQARAVTTTKDPWVVEWTRTKESESDTVLVRGSAIGQNAGQGRVHVIADARDIGRFKKGEVLVTDMTNPNWVPIMRKASAIVTNKGGKTCHAAIIARELGIPCVIGTGNATSVLADVKEVTVGGEHGEVFLGLVPLEHIRIDLRETIRLKKELRTKVMLILADPKTAPKYSFYPNDGIGLARLEFIIASFIQIHPMLALEEDPAEILVPKGLTDPLEKARALQELARFRDITCGYTNAKEFFVEKLTHGIMQLAACAWPNPIIVRLSDFKSNEYRRLLGGAHFEPHEENPMLGLRGASRYYDLRYRPAFQEIECVALRAARDAGFTNIKAMIPFVRTAAEARKVVALMAGTGLVRGENGFEVYCMTELPANVLELEGLAEIFDGFSIGSNDLTQLTLGMDRDSADIAHIADERDPAVMKLITMAIEKARACGKPIGICGQAPTNHQKYAKFLVDLGITSISVQPDAIPATVKNVSEAEQKLK